MFIHTKLHEVYVPKLLQNVFLHTISLEVGRTISSWIFLHETSQIVGGGEGGGCNSPYFLTTNIIRVTTPHIVYISE
jgi:hypothetical protein